MSGRIRVGVVPAAGRGRRMADLPLTRVLPKPMLPVLAKPILEYVVGNMKKVGVEVIYIIVGWKQRVIRDYFGKGELWGVRISYLEQKEPRGIAHAISLTRGFIKDPFWVIMGDDLTVAPSLDCLPRTFWGRGAWVVEGVMRDHSVASRRRTCCVELGEGNRIVAIEEKPQNPRSEWRGLGVYLFDPIVFDFIDRTPVSAKRNEREITDTVSLIAKEGRAWGAVVQGVNINVNTLEDLRRATQVLLAGEKAAAAMSGVCCAAGGGRKKPPQRGGLRGVPAV